MEVNASLTCVPVLFSNGVWPIGGPTVAEELCRDVRFALGFKVVKKLRLLTDSERDLVAAAGCIPCLPARKYLKAPATWQNRNFLRSELTNPK